MKTAWTVLVLLACTAVPALAQQSDYAVKKSYEERYRQIADRIDSSTTMQELDSLRDEITKLETAYAGHQEFLDKALYPTTLSESLHRLKSLQVLTYDRIYLIQTQGIKLSELEGRIASLGTRLDSLTAQRDQLFGELQESKKSLSSLREAVRRLTTTLRAKDQLIFALVDSIFLPYGKDVHQVADVHKEAIEQKLEKANVVTRVYEIAADNVKFLEVTQLQGKDYANLVEQYEMFSGRWGGLKEKMAAVAATSAVAPAVSTGKPAPKTGSGKEGPSPAHLASQSAATQASHVDSVIAEWHAKLNAAFWGSLQKEFTDAGIAVMPFHDGTTFSASIRAYVASLKAGRLDPAPFVDVVWKQKVDKEWRDALTKESMLGKTEYASLDKLVSEVSKESIDLKLILYLAGVVVIIALLWYFLFRKKGAGPAEQKAA
jgi:hypothetical protein